MIQLKLIPDSPEPQDSLERYSEAPQAPEKRKNGDYTGHAAKPGSGPPGETCGSCQLMHSRKVGDVESFRCFLNRPNWDFGVKCRVKPDDKACRFWKIL